MKAELINPNEVFKYDIDIVKAIFEIEKIIPQVKRLKNKHTRIGYMDTIFKHAKYFYKAHKRTLKDLNCFDRIIVSCNSGYYISSLSLDLLWRPIHDLKFYLNYHRDNYGNKKIEDWRNFVGTIQFIVKENIFKAAPFEVSERLNVINDWIDESNLILGKAPSKKRVIYKWDISDELYIYFENTINIEDRRKFKSLLKGEEIEGTITYLGQSNNFTDVFATLKEVKIRTSTNKSVIDWIVQYFKYETENIHDFDRNYIRNCLKKNQYNSLSNDETFKTLFLERIDSKGM